MKQFFLKKEVLCLAFLLLITQFIVAENRWSIQPNGAIKWMVDERIPHYDHIEMSGESISTVLRYGVNPDKSFRLERSVIWPMLRTVPNNTHASLTKKVGIDVLSSLIVDGQSLKNEHVESLELDGCLTVTSNYFLSFVQRAHSQPAIQIKKTFFPSVKDPVWCEKYRLKNLTEKALEIMIPEFRTTHSSLPENGVNGSYTIIGNLQNAGTFIVNPGDEIDFTFSIQAFSVTKGEKEQSYDIANELKKRKAFIHEMWSNLVLETPDEVIDRAFAFAKIRASESIYRTAGGLMHEPGGEAYYAAIWANDESEYVAPFFPFLGYKTANEATLNTFRLYMPFMNDAYNAVPSSIIAEGTDIWHGAGDCGDAAMLAYGGIRYALTRANMEEAKYIWPLMEWCLEFCNRRLNEYGVVKSDSDELEGRFPSGEANLLVSSLYYDALVSAAYLGKDLGLASTQTIFIPVILFSAK